MDTDNHALRLAPIDRPLSWWVRIFNWLTRSRLGKVMMPARVIYARFPALLWRTLPLYHLSERGLSIDAGLRHLIEVYVSELNGCTFCSDIHRAQALRAHPASEKLAALSSGEEAACFDARERAALRYVREIAQGGRVSDATFSALRAVFSEREVVEVTWLSAFVTYLNRMAVPLGIGSDGFCALITR